MRSYDPLSRIVISVSLATLLLGSFPFSLPSAQAVAPRGEDVHLLQSDAAGIVLELQVPAYTVRTVEVDGRSYQRLSIQGYGLSSTPGKPELPQRGLLLGIPPHAEADLEVLHVESTSAGGFNVYPVPERSIKPLDPGLAPLDEVSDVQVKFVKNQSVYATNAFFPSAVAEIGDRGYLRDQRYVQVLIHPVQYNPVTGELKHHHYIKLQVSFSYPQGRLSLTPGRTESHAFETVLQNSILNYETAKVWRSGPQPKAQAMGASLDYLTPPSYKIPVSQDGIYQLTYTDTLNGGIDVARVDPRTFEMYNQGGEVAIYVEGESDGKFNQNDYILFYGQKKMDTKYTDTNVYWLRYGEADVLRMDDKDSTPAGAASPVAFRNTVRLEEDLLYIPSVPIQEGADHWYWNSFNAPSLPTQSYTTTLNNVATGSYSCTLRSRIQGFTTGGHHLDFYINDHHDETLVADWNGQTEYAGEIPFPQSYLVEDINTIEITATSGSADVGFINWFEIDYYDTYVAENDSLRFSGDEAGTWEYHVGGFITADVEAFDVTDPANPSRIINATVESGSSHILKFQDTISAPGEYVALTTAQRLSPLSITLDTRSTPSNLHSEDNGADYIIITHSDFYTDVLPLADHRAAQGLRTLVIDVQDIYDEFSYGVFDAEAIRDFLSYAYTHWIAPAPSYVLLVGDGNWNFKGLNPEFYGPREPNYIPPYMEMVEPHLNGERATDNRYVCISGDDVLADMHIGRLPAQTSAQASAMVNKILSYEQSPASGNWSQNILFVADNYPDDAGNFPGFSDDIADNYLPSSYVPDKVYYKIPPYNNSSDVRIAIVNAINDGCLLINYIGHGAIQYWAAEKLFRINDITSLSNDQELSMILPMTCYEGYFDYPNFPCLGESIVRAEGKGAIASWSATGAGMALGHHYLNKGFFTAVFNDKQDIGTATYLGKLNLFTNTTGYHDLLDTYVLFGDPFMKLNLPACSAADFDNDGQITVVDIMQVAACWGTQWGDEDFDRRYDLDNDGQITVVDIMKVATQWRKTCATP
jgi:hypothetical protein